MVIPNHHSKDTASSSTSSSSSNQRYRHPTSYTLYIEHLGTIIPVLEATKRSYKIRQAFGISLPSTSGTNPSAPQSQKSSSSITESDALFSNNEGTVTTNSSQMRVLGHEAHLSLNTESGIQVACHDDDSDSPRHPTPSTSNSVPFSIDGTHKPPTSMLDNSRYLAEVTSNIMTSKFKIVGLSDKVPADMGSVMIKTSFLHIQPRKVIAYLPHPELTTDSGIDTDISSDESIMEEGINSTSCSADVFMEPESHSIESLMSMEELLLPKSVEPETQPIKLADTSLENTVSKPVSSGSQLGSGNNSNGTYSCTSTNVRGQRVSVSESHIQIHSKTPTWNEQHMIYQLDFGGRVTTKSAKNFQLETDNEQVTYIYAVLWYV